MAPTQRRPNDLFRAARLSVPSPSGSGQPMSREELADAANRQLPASDPDGPITANHIGKIERGVVTWPRLRRRQALRAVLSATTDADLGLYNIRRQATSKRNDPDLGTPIEEAVAEATRPRDQSRETVTGMVRASRARRIATNGLPQAGTQPPSNELTERIGEPGPMTRAIAQALMALPSGEPRDVVGMDVLEAAVAALRSSYQHSRYGRAAARLPRLMTEVQQAVQIHTDGQMRRRALELAAAVYQVASGILLKVDDAVLAAVAADRSMQAAQMLGDPLTIASSARAQVHTLLATGHAGPAVALAVTAAERLEHDARTSDESLSVRGALVLRAATAAAHREDRATAARLLEEATGLGSRLGRDANACWTAFGPTNVVLHRVAAAVDLGDAGAAVHLAATVNLQAVPLPERRAVLFLDTAQALMQWGKFQRAFNAIRIAEQHAPEEVHQRVSVHRLVIDLLYRCPPSMHRVVREYAWAIGAAA